MTGVMDFSNNICSQSIYERFSFDLLFVESEGMFAE